MTPQRIFIKTPGTSTCGDAFLFQGGSLPEVKGVLNRKCQDAEEDIFRSRRGELWQHQDNCGRDREESGMTRAGRTLRNNKYKKVVENVRQKKQLFTPEIKKLLKEWLVRRRKYPYPSRSEKRELALETGLTYMQICNWFANWRRKLRKNTTGDTWGCLITGYNRQAHGNCEQFSISSRDSIWDEANYNHHPSESNPESPQVSRTVSSSAASDSLQHIEEDRMWISPSAPERPVTSALVKWLESAAKFRPREASWSPSLNCWGGSPSCSRKPRRPRGRLRTIGKSRGRHREELDAAEALTFLSIAAVQSQR